MRKAQFLALIFASGMTSSDMNNQSSAFSSTEDSQKDSSGLSSLQFTAEGYKKVFFSITSSTQNEYSMSSEIPENF